MSNLRAKSKLVTYSRAKRKLLNDDDDGSIIKRRRVETIEIRSDSSCDGIETGGSSAPPSSPPAACITPDSAIFSTQNEPASTPPSSPPVLMPASKEPRNDPAIRPDYNMGKSDAFAMVRRQPLNRPNKKPLVQMQLNLGQAFRKKCKSCGMEFVPSSLEDSALHRKFHSRNVDGIYVSKEFVRKAEGWGGIEWHGKDGEDRIISISRHSRCQSGRQYIMPVLDVVQTELGAVDIPYNLLWSLCYTPLPFPSRSGAQDPDVSVEAAKKPCYDRYKVYLYTRGTKCVGLCLVERINKAYKVLDPEEEVSASASSGDEQRRLLASDRKQVEISLDEDHPVVVSETTDDAWMGVSRIWVSSSFRKQGVARTLLDIASKTFLDKRTTPKELVAFSQTTQSGARLARRWFGKEYGWHIYTDCNVTMESDKGNWYSRREDESHE